MAAFAYDLIVLLVLAAVASAGCVRWIGPYRSTLDAQAKGLLALAILTIAGGAIGSPFWWMAVPESFSWQLPPLAFRMLGAAGIAFSVTGIYAVERRRASLIRVYIALLAVYLAPLVAAILLFHLDRFNWRAPITYAFFVVAGGMAAAAIWHLARHTTLPPFEDTNQLSPPALGARVFLSIVATIFGAWGIVLFVFPSGPITQIWVWPQDPLTSRLIAAMLLTIAATGILGRVNVNAVKMSAWMFAVNGAGVTVACVTNLARGKPAPLSYAAVFAILALASLLLLALPSNPSTSPRHSKGQLTSMD